LKFKLQKELPGIFNWAMIGLKRLAQRGHFKTTERMSERLSELKMIINHASQFLLDFVKPDDQGSIFCVSLYRRYCTWAEARGIRSSEILSDSEFGKEVKRLFPFVERKRKTSGARPWMYSKISEVYSSCTGILYLEGKP
jgi:putative DNA primase/helicase